MELVADRVGWVAHASRVSGFGVAPKRTSPMRLHLFYTLFLPRSPVVRKVREPETASPARERRALPGIEIRQRNLALTNESVIECDVRLRGAANLLVSDSP